MMHPEGRFEPEVTAMPGTRPGAGLFSVRRLPFMVPGTGVGGTDDVTWLT